MDTNVTYKFYRTPTGSYAVLPGYNVGPGYSEVSYQDFKNATSTKGFTDASTGTNYADIANPQQAYAAGLDPRNGKFYTQASGMSYYEELLNGTDANVANAIRLAEQGLTQDYGKVIDGNLTSNEAIQQEADNQAKVASGEYTVTYQNGVPVYQPVGAAPFEQGSVGQDPGMTVVAGATTSTPTTTNTSGLQQSYTIDGQTAVLDPNTGRYEYATNTPTPTTASGLQQSYTINGQTAYLDPNTGRYEYAQPGITSPQVVTPQTASQTPQPTTTAPVPANGSIVDYLNSTGQAPDFDSRAQLAAQLGIQNYTGTAAQNTQLLQMVSSGQTAQAPVTQPTQPVQTPTQNQGTFLPDQSYTAPDGTPGYYNPQTGRYESTPQTPQQAANPEPVQQNPAQTGQPVTPQTQTGKTPAQNVIDTYNQVYKELGLMTVKQQLDDVVKRRQTIENELTDKIVDVNNNPWLSEGVRVREVKKLQDKYEARINTESNMIKLLDSIYQQGQMEARFLVGEIQEASQEANALAVKLAQDQMDAEMALLKDNQIVEINGQMRLVNKSTGQTVAILGPKEYTPTPTTSPTSPTNPGVTPVNSSVTLQNASQLLEASRNQGAEADGIYADPNLYYRVYQLYTSQPGKTLQQFLSAYPPKNYVNPANTFLPSFLMPPKTTTSTREA